MQRLVVDDCGMTGMEKWGI